MNANEPAFPNSHDNPTFTARGLSKRELIAALAMQGLLANDHIIGDTDNKTSEQRYAIIAVKNADALLAELARTEPKEAR